jgi:hypothetical protein
MGVEIIHGVALQAADFYRLFVVAMQNTGAFAQNIHWAHAGTACAQNIRIQNSERRAAQVSAGDFFDEARDVDVGGAGSSTGRIEAIEAAIRLGERGVRTKRRVDFGKTLGYIRAGVKRHAECMMTNSEPRLRGSVTHRGCRGGAPSRSRFGNGCRIPSRDRESPLKNRHEFGVGR